MILTPHPPPIPAEAAFAEDEIHVVDARGALQPAGRLAEAGIARLRRQSAALRAVHRIQMHFDDGGTLEIGLCLC